MERDELVAGRRGTIFRTVNYLYRDSGLQHRTLTTFVNSTLLQFTQLYEYVSKHKQWWILCTTITLFELTAVFLNELNTSEMVFDRTDLSECE